MTNDQGRTTNDQGRTTKDHPFHLLFFAHKAKEDFSSVHQFSLAERNKIFPPFINFRSQSEIDEHKNEKYHAAAG